MKKILLFAAALFAASAVYADDLMPVNGLVVNGDFEAPGYAQEVPGDYTWDPWNKQNYLTTLPGWTVDRDTWNGGVELCTGDDWVSDGLVRPEEDVNVVKFVGYNDNGWYDIKMTQVVSGLVAGAEYNLDYLVAARFPAAEETANSWAPDPDFGYRISEVSVNAENVEEAGKLIKEENLATRSDWENGAIDFLRVGPVAFTAPADGKIFLNIYMANKYGDKNKKDGLWMIVDMVSITGDNAGVANVAIEENAPVEYFNLQGVRVANPENGIFVRRQGSKTSKVVL